ncbi:MAG: 23S rRNA (guanosine(2251)-2'-O)-methyltransferase RlmB [Finegoldia sp.]|nr:23S rRNA (guanosine(2251)-2'-O)-methyltransferase RlmB [Finegoldia sp.]
MEFLVGRNPVLEALDMNVGVEKIYIKKGELKGSIRAIEKKAHEKNIDIEFVDKDFIEKKAEGNAHQGVMAKIRGFSYSNMDEMLIYAKKRNEDPKLIILDEITDPHNLGSIIRTAEVAGFHGVIIPKHRASEVNVTAIKSSAGAAFNIRVAKVTNISQAISYLKEHGIWIYGACGESATDYTKTDLTGPIALVIGNEGKGISRLVRENCDELIKIPMYGKTESLNASNAASILIYEVIRQTNEKK